MEKKSNFGKFLTGAVIGAGLGILFAPKTGEETRKELKKKIDELIQKTKEIDVDEVKENILNKINEIEVAVKDLDKEKALNIAKEKAKQIEEKTTELVNMAIDSAKPKLEQMAEDVKKSTIKNLKVIIKKLETKDTQPKKTVKKATK